MNTAKLLVANQARTQITYDNGVSTCMSLPNEINAANKFPLSPGIMHNCLCIHYQNSIH